MKRSWPLFLVAGLAFVPGLGILFGAAGATWGLLSNRPRAMFAAVIGATGALLQMAAFVVWFARARPESPGLTRAVIQVTQQDLGKLVGALDAYYAEHRQYPATLRALQRSGLGMRFVNIYDQGIGMFRMPQPYQYAIAPDGGGYDVYSAGPDRQAGTPDDIRPVIPDSLRARTGYRPAK